MRSLPHILSIFAALLISAGATFPAQTQEDPCAGSAPYKRGMDDVARFADGKGGAALFTSEHHCYLQGHADAITFAFEGLLETLEKAISQTDGEMKLPGICTADCNEDCPRRKLCQELVVRAKKTEKTLSQEIASARQFAIADNKKMSVDELSSKRPSPPSTEANAVEQIAPSQAAEPTCRGFCTTP